MKRFLITLGILVTCALSAYADVEGFQCAADYKTSGGFSRFFGGVSGTSFALRKTAENIIKSAIQKDAQGNFDVKLESFSAKDLIDGKFKSLAVTGEGIVAENVHLSYLKVKTICDFNHIVINNKDNTIIFKENFGLRFGAIFSEDDLNNSMYNEKYIAIIDKLNSFGKKTRLFKIKSARVKILNDKFIYIIRMSLPYGSKSMNLVVSSDINVHEGKIVFTEADVLNDYVRIDLSKLTYLLNRLNPLNFSLSILKNKHADMRVQEAAIKDNKIYVNGIITVDKDVVAGI